MIKFGDCRMDEFLAMMEQRGPKADRAYLIDMFKRAAGAVGTKRASPQEQQKLIAFIAEGRKTNTTP